MRLGGMNAFVVGLVVAAGSTEVEGAVSISGLLARHPQAGTTFVEAHARVDLSREFGRFFVDGRASLLANGAASGVGFGDLGSRLRVGYRPAGVVESVSLEILPFNSTLRLVSFDWANAWGQPGLPPYPMAPVLTAELTTKALRFSFSARFKSVSNAVSSFNEVAPDFFAGVDATLPMNLRFELRGATLSRGLNGPLGGLGIALPLTAAGAGARLSWNWHEAVAPAVDLTTYATDPTRFERLFVAETRRVPFAATLGLEAGGAGQQLADPAAFGKGKTQLMGWADFQARLRLHQFRLFGTLRVQSVTHPIFDFPGVPPGTAFAADTVTSPAVVGFLGADYAIRALRLTPGVLLRIVEPAWVGFPRLPFGGDSPPPAEQGTRYTYWLPSGIFGIVPAGRRVAPILGAKASARWDVVSFVSVVTELDVEVDLNDPTIPGLESAQRTDRVRVRGQLLMQTRF